jgi:hypothetical protein
MEEDDPPKGVPTKTSSKNTSGDNAEPQSGDLDLLRRVAENGQAHMAEDKQAQAFLRRNGIADTEIWRKFRVASGAADLRAALSPQERQRLHELWVIRPSRWPGVAGSGILLPTCDPRDWRQPLGFIRLLCSQKQHAFVTAARGIVCTEDAKDQEQLILADAPLTGLFLAQAGGRGVCLVEDPSVLPPLLEFFRKREIVLVSHKKQGTAKMAAALGTIKIAAEVFLSGKLEWHAEALAALGLNIPKPKRPRVRLTQKHVVELVRYAQERLAAGHGVEVLRRLNADQGELSAALQFGYLPADYRNCLDRKTRQAWQGHLIGNSIIVPALDEQGVPIDFCAVRNGRTTPSVYEHPQGLIGARLVDAFEKLIVTDSLALMAKLFGEGNRNVLLLRGPGDALRNAKRIKASGVREILVICHSGGGETVEVLSKADIMAVRGNFPKFIHGKRVGVSGQGAGKRRVAAQAQVFKHCIVSARNPKLLKYDPLTEEALFEAGEIRYSADVGPDGTRVLLRMERDGRAHVDRFDLASEAQRRRFAMSAAPKAKESFERIEAHLLSLFDQISRFRIQAKQHPRPTATAVELSASEREAALSELKRPDLLDAIAADLESLGWVGEDQAKRLLYLTAVSRKLPRPLSAVRVAASGAGKSFGLELVAELTPPEDLLHLTRLTDAALYYHERDGLRHKLLLVDEASALTPETLTTLRVLQSRGAVSHSHVLRDAEGENVAQYTQAQGPVAVFTSTTGKLDEQNLSRCFVVSVDESREQTIRVLEAQRRMRAQPDSASGQRRAAMVDRHRNMQRLLESQGVLIPFADRIGFPAQTVKHRREQERFLNLIETSALLHQYQRKRQVAGNGVEIVVAERSDFECAKKLASDSILRANDDFSQNARDVLLTIAGSKLTTFSINDLRALRPEWTRYKFRTGLGELAELEILVSANSGRGRVRHFALHEGTTQALSGCSVRLEQVGELATVGETDFANFIPLLAKS